MHKRNNNSLVGKIQFSILFLLGGSYIFAILNLTYWLMFRYFIFCIWIYLIPIIVLSPGWLIPLAKCQNIKSILLWMLGVIVISFFINFMGHYGLGGGDLGPGPV